MTKHLPEHPPPWKGGLCSVPSIPFISPIDTTLWLVVHNLYHLFWCIQLWPSRQGQENLLNSTQKPMPLWVAGIHHQDHITGSNVVFSSTYLFPVFRVDRYSFINLLQHFVTRSCVNCHFFLGWIQGHRWPWVQVVCLFGRKGNGSALQHVHHWDCCYNKWAGGNSKFLLPWPLRSVVLHWWLWITQGLCAKLF